jgi:hypothetical protein
MFLQILYSLPNYILLLLLWMSYILYALIGGFLTELIIKDKNFEDSGALGPMCGLATTMFAILGAFVAIGALTTYRAAESLVQREAANVSAIYNSAFALPDNLRKEVQANIFAYAQHVINVEWAAMRDEKVNVSAQVYLDHILQQADQYAIKSQIDFVIMTQTINRIFSLYEIHRERADSVNSSLETTTWVVLIIISLVAISLNFFYVMKSPFIRYVALGCTSMVVASVIFLIIMYDHPFRGTIAVTPQPLIEVADRISQISHNEIINSWPKYLQ